MKRATSSPSCTDRNAEQLPSSEKWRNRPGAKFKDFVHLASPLKTSTGFIYYIYAGTLPEDDRLSTPPSTSEN